MKKKGNYLLKEDFFEGEIREFLPVNLYILRQEKNGFRNFDTRFYIKSKYHRNNQRVGGIFYKPISNII